MPGPPPKHPSRRGRGGSTAAFTTLPAKGFTGKVPPWPLLPDPHQEALKNLAEDKVAALQVEIEEAEDGRTRGRLRRQLAQAEQSAAVLSLQMEQQADTETELWLSMWGTPQAVMWDQSVAFQRTLALFVRWQVRAEQGDLKATAEARQLSDRLGLNPLALQRLRAEIENADAAEAKGRQRRAAAPKRKPGDGDDPRSVLTAAS